MRIRARDLPALYGGTPALIVLPGVAAPEALDLPGLSLWLADTEGRLHRPGETAPDATVPLPGAPPALLAVVAPAPPALGWPDPPVILAADGAAALPALAARAVAAWVAHAAEAGALHRAMAAARQEAEEARLAFEALLHAAAAVPAPEPPDAVLAAMPADAAVELDGPLGQALGLRLSGLCAIALHIATAEDVGTLRVRLFGAESGRMAGAWVVPGEALRPGWLTLDLPMPVGPLRESACLELRAEGGRLALSLEARRVAAERGAGGGDRPLALRAWTAPFGRRLVQPLHWDPEAPGLMVGGAAVTLPDAVFAAARGAASRVAVGEGPARLLVRLAAGERRLVVLPAVPVHGLDLLEAELTVALGDPGTLEAALWLQPEAPADEAALTLEGPLARWSGWRRATPDGLRLPLALPLAPPRHAAVALALRHLGAAGDPALHLEWSALCGRRTAPPVVPATPPAAPPATPAALGAVRLQEHWASTDGGYRHLDLLVEDLRADGHTWPRVRVKLARRGEGPALEFRLRPDWPVMFETWPGRAADDHGPVLLLEAADFARPLPGTPRDRALLAALTRLLPLAVAHAARDAVLDAGELEDWIAAARLLAAMRDQSIEAQ